MWKYSQEHDSKLIIGKVIEAILDDDGAMSGVKLDDGSTIDCDALVIACGPWTDATRTWFPSKIGNSIPKMMGVKYHSILIQSPRVLNQAVFFSGHGDPEVYPRPDGDAYITGFPDAAVVVTESPGNEEVRSDVVARLIDATKKVSSELGPIPPVSEYYLSAMFVLSAVRRSFESLTPLSKPNTLSAHRTIMLSTHNK